MKRFKVFKIIYYGFMVVIGVILCFVLPGYNQYNALTKEIKSDIKTENYGDVPGFFASYYNREPVAKASNDTSSLFLYEATTYEKINDSDYYYAHPVYMGFLYNVKSYNTETILDSNGKEENNKKVVYSDGTNEFTVLLDGESLYYMNELNFIYFTISEAQFEASNLEYIKEISIYDAKNTEFISLTSSSNLNYESTYFDTSDEYTTIFNQMYTDLQLTVNGSNGAFNSQENSTAVSAGGKITYTPTGPSVLRIEASDISAFTIEGATLIEGKTNEYQMKHNTEVTITANKDTNLEGVVVVVGEIDIRYAFDGKTTGDYNYPFESNDGSTNITILGKGYVSDNQQAEFDTWLEKYEFTKTNYSDALDGLTTKTIFQIIGFFIIMMIIGDFVVGKHHIIYFFQRVFGKVKKNKKEEEPEFKNEYDVNLMCSVHVPVGYTKPVKLVYKKDDKNIASFELLKEHNYKAAMRIQNGIYKFESYEAEGLHPIKKPVEVTIRGYKYELTVNFGYDDKTTNQVKDEKPVLVEDTTDTVEE